MGTTAPVLNLAWLHRDLDANDNGSSIIRQHGGLWITCCSQLPHRKSDAPSRTFSYIRPVHLSITSGNGAQLTFFIK